MQGIETEPTTIYLGPCKSRRATKAWLTVNPEINATATSKAEAIQKCADLRDTFLRSVTERPIILNGRGEAQIAFPYGDSWTIHYVAGTVGDYSCSIDGDRRKVEWRMRRHLAANALDLDSNDPDDAIEFIHRSDDEGRAEHRRNARWQFAYRDAIAAGHDDHEAHAIACRA